MHGMYDAWTTKFMLILRFAFVEKNGGVLCYSHQVKPSWEDYNLKDSQKNDNPQNTLPQFMDLYKYVCHE